MIASVLLVAALVAAQGHTPPARSSRAPLQLLVVTTPAWDSVSGTLRRYARATPHGPWRAVGEPVPIVVGQSGLAWGEAVGGRPSDPRKREGDGRAPAGRFTLGTAFGFAPSSGMNGVQLPYLQLADDTECVDDPTSEHYNTLVGRSAQRRVDWASSERMRTIDLYRLGVVVRYNTAPVRRGRGSCIFLHIWRAAGSPTSGCTAMPAADLDTVVAWLDPARHPTLVQLPVAEYARLRAPWGLP